MNAPDTTSKVTHHGDGAELFLLFLKNIVLTMLTLGVYRFWGKTATRRYLWSKAELWGDRFEWTGQGMELFVGFLKAMVLLVPVFIVPFAILSYLRDPKLFIPFYLFAYPAFGFLAFYAGYTARRYRLSRTVWRGIRGGLDGRPLDYAKKALGYAVLTALTLGFYSPYMTMKLTKIVTDNTEFGSQKMSFDGQGADLFGTYVKAFLLMPFTLGLSMIWYQGESARYVFEHTRFGEVRFKLNADGFDFLGLMLTNMLLVFFTLGFGAPWAILRAIRFVCDRLQITGRPDFAQLGQNQRPRQKTGEGLMDLIDGEIA